MIKIRVLCYEREMMYLSGDIGGTKTHLAVFIDENGSFKCLKESKFPSRNYPNLRLIIQEFLKDSNFDISKACFGIAGPIKNGKSQATNLPWLIDSAALKEELSISKICLINDLEANAYGIRVLSDDEFCVLNQGHVVPGNQAMISAGTGLGEAGIFFHNEEFFPFPSEGGHSDFAPTNRIEDNLLYYLRKRFTHVSYERILSGPGLYNVYQFIVETGEVEEDLELYKSIASGNSPALISEYAINHKSKACFKALELFVSIYGAEAGNLCLKILSLGGLYIGGGIAPKILPFLQCGKFLQSFTSKGRFRSLLEGIPIKVVLNEKTALLGAMFYSKNFM